MNKKMSLPIHIAISITSNGCVLKDENGIASIEYDIELNEIKDARRVADLINSIISQLTMTSRYSKYRIFAKIEHGDKYECKDKNCQICNGDNI